MTYRFVVLGDPVEHSLSPALHQAALRVAGLDGRYERRRVDEEGMREAVAELRSGELDGANVTMPHKGLAATLVDRVEGEAVQAGSVNTLVRSESGICGYSTDVPAIRETWERAGLPAEGPVLILGSGGAAAAAAVACSQHQIWVSARDTSKALAMADRIGIDVRPHRWGDAFPSGVIVNATPLGIRGESLPRGLVVDSSGLFDMAYGALPTPAATLARSLGLPAVDGLEMLASQAARSFQLWTGYEVPPSVMLTAAQKAQGWS